MLDSVDYIIVGAGSAGCVMAAELSANPENQVLVIESGPSDKDFLIEMPRGIGKILSPDNKYVWSYDIEKGGNRGVENWLKGKTLGGSSSVNGMVYVRGFASDYDRWAHEYGCEGWSWADMKPHFIAHEDHAFGANNERGVGGPLRITGHPVDEAGAEPKALCEAFLTAAEQIGVPRFDDPNMASDGGAGYQPRNISGGRRQSAAKAFLRPAMSRSNLTVMHSTHVSRLIFEGKRISGVEIQTASGSRVIHCRKEVVLSAGAIESPKLLQLSGIGDAERLQALGVPVVHDLPAVGQNLREHFYIQMKYRVTKGSLNSEFQGFKLLWNVLRYVLLRSGPMGNAAQEMMAYIKSREGLARPDCQVGAGLYTLKRGDHGPELESEPGFTIGGYHMHPQSQGEMYITSTDAKQAPYIRANYLEHPEDQAASIGMVKTIRKLVEQSALAPFITSELYPGIEIQDDAAILEAFHAQGGTAYHVSGTCRMGSDENSVVDPQARVRGIEGVRVVDTSIFPELPSGNTNAPAMAAGRNVAKMMLEA